MSKNCDELFSSWMSFATNLAQRTSTPFSAVRRASDTWHGLFVKRFLFSAALGMMIVLLIICILYVVIASLLIHGARKVQPLAQFDGQKTFKKNLMKIITHRARLAC